MTIVTFTHKVIGSILAFENFQSQGNGQRGCGGTVLDQGGGSILPHSKYNDNATTLRLPSFNRKPLLLILLLLLLAAPLVSHFKALKGSQLHHCWCRRERDKFFVNIGRRKMDRWNMTTVYSFNVLRSKGGAPRTIKWSKQQNKSFDFFIVPALTFFLGRAKSFNIFDLPSKEFWYFWWAEQRVLIFFICHANSSNIFVWPSEEFWYFWLAEQRVLLFLIGQAKSFNIFYWPSKEFQYLWLAKQRVLIFLIGQAKSFNIFDWPSKEF